MQYGMTYMVRPFMQPANSASILAWPSAGDIQWLLGTGIFLLRRADEGQVLDAGDVVGMGAMQPAARVGFGVQRDQGAVGFHPRDERGVSRRRCRRTSGSHRVGSEPLLVQPSR
jgi:hypothetical protein